MMSNISGRQIVAAVANVNGISYLSGVWLMSSLQASVQTEVKEASLWSITLISRVDSMFL